jgi:hypothetical protein
MVGSESAHGAWQLMWVFATGRPWLASLTLISLAYLVRREARVIVSPFYSRARALINSSLVRAAAHSRQSARSISRYQDELDHLTPRSLIEDIVFILLMGFAFYMGVKLSYWLAENPIHLLLDKLGAHAVGPLTAAIREHELLIGATIVVEVFCGIMFLELVGGTEVFGIFRTYKSRWRRGYAVLTGVSIIGLIFLDHMIVRSTLEHLKELVSDNNATAISAYPRELQDALKDGVRTAINQVDTAKSITDVVSYVLASLLTLILALILFPLDIIKDIFPLVTFFYRWVFWTVLTLLLCTTLVLLCVITLLSQAVFRTLLFLPLLLEALLLEAWRRLDLPPLRWKA